MNTRARNPKALLTDALWEAYATVRVEGWNILRPQILHAWNWAVETYVFPKHLWQVGVACLTFFVMMLGICMAVELNNDLYGSAGRWRQIRLEIFESFFACVASTSVSVFHLNYIYPLRWGFRPPVLPSSMSVFLLECVYWLVCFEVFVYALHRFLHLRKPVDVYRWIHRSVGLHRGSRETDASSQHHLYFFPSAFAAQAIHPIEAILFAETSLLATVFLFPISVATQYTCGVLLLVWSIMAHDSRFILDLGAHYEHHSHPQTNFGFLGLVDVVMDTVWWGRAVNGEDKPAYYERMAKLHRAFFGKDPKVLYDGISEDAELEARIKNEARDRRQRYVASLAEKKEW